MKTHKISALLDNFFFHSFQGGTKGKMLKNGQNYTLVFPVGNEAYADDFSCLSHWEVRNPLPLYNVGVTNKNAF